GPSRAASLRPDAVSERLDWLARQQEPAATLSESKLAREGEQAGSDQLLLGLLDGLPNDFLLQQSVPLAISTLERLGPDQDSVRAVAHGAQALFHQDQPELAERAIGLLDKWREAGRLAAPEGNWKALLEGPLAVEQNQIKSAHEAPPQLPPLAWAEARALLAEGAQLTGADSAQAATFLVRARPSGEAFSKLTKAFTDQPEFFRPLAGHLGQMASRMQSLSWQYPEPEPLYGREPLQEFYASFVATFPEAVDRDLVQEQLLPLTHELYFSDRATQFWRDLWTQKPDSFGLCLDDLCQRRPKEPGRFDLFVLQEARRRDLSPDPAQAQWLASRLIRAEGTSLDDKVFGESLQLLSRQSANLTLPDSQGQSKPLGEALFDRMLNDADPGLLPFLASDAPASQAFYQLATPDLERLEGLVQAGMSRGGIEAMEKPEEAALVMLNRLDPERLQPLVADELEREQSYYILTDVVNKFRDRALTDFTGTPREGLRMLMAGDSAKLTKTHLQDFLSTAPVEPETWWNDFHPSDLEKLTPDQKASFLLYENWTRRDAGERQKFLAWMGPRLEKLGDSGLRTAYDQMRQERIEANLDQLAQPADLSAAFSLVMKNSTMADKVYDLDRGDIWKASAAAFHRGLSACSDWRRELAAVSTPGNSLEIARYLDQQVGDKLVEYWPGFAPTLRARPGAELREVAADLRAYAEARSNGLDHAAALRTLVIGEAAPITRELQLEIDQLWVGDISLEIHD
ncbi:MAG: hypothetical protein KC910_27210, partial [Candidatus Eremiobacteraeota bacterium]|nr:hypothetical protein [Candidatus Eremiobacteraeota bacterium]